MGTAVWSCLLLALIVITAQLQHTCFAIDAKCSACEAVAAELERRLEAEKLKPRDPLDLRHRLDKDGKRYGKVIDYKLSELRAIELLEDLCDEMDNYSLVRLKIPVVDTTSITDADSSSKPGTDGSGSSGEESDGSSSGNSSSSSSSSGGSEAKHVVKRRWMKVKGEGRTVVPQADRPDSAEEEVRRKQLTTFCGMTLEEQEDEVVGLLRGGGFPQGVAPVLCQKLTRSCANKVYPHRQQAQEVEGAGGGDASSRGAGEL